MNLTEELKASQAPAHVVDQVEREAGDLTKINKMSDDVWVITHPITLVKSELIWSEAIPQATPLQLLVLKQHLKDLGKSENDGTLMLKRFPDRIMESRWLIVALNSLDKAPVSRLNQLSASDVMALIELTLWKKNSTKKTVVSRGTISKRWLMLNMISETYSSGQLVDGFKEIPSLTSVLDTIKPIVSLNTDWADWLAEGSYGSVPLPIASVYLKEAIEIIRSEKLKWYQFITSFVRKRQSIIPSQLFDRVVQRSADGWRIPRTGRQSKELVKFLNEARCFFSLGQEQPLPPFPFKNGTELTNHSSLLHGAALVIFFFFSGARRSEIVSIQNDDLIKQSDGTYRFKSEIKKTNHGIVTVRDIAGLAAEAYDVLESVNLNPDSNERDNIFFQTTFCWARTAPRTLKHGAYNSVPIRLQQFATYVEQKYGDEFAYSHKITPHQFRHTFAEFALRRFDGNVVEAIRDHFRHEYGSYMTHRYTRRKFIEGMEKQESYVLSDLLKTDSRIVRDYIGEIITRAANGEQLYGAIGRWIADRVKDIEFLDPATLNQIIDEFEGDIHPHEYGICMIRKESKMQAQCFDKESGTANTSEARWSLCGNCVNRLSFSNNKDAILRIGMKSQVHAESFKKSGLITIANLEEANIKTAMAAVAEIDSGEGNV